MGINSDSSRRSTVSFTDFGMRRAMYSATRSTIGPTVSGCNFGALPIFEKRSATISNRRTSASISSMSASSGWVSRITAIQAISDEMGVPNW